jgi:hypothetical protein
VLQSEKWIPTKRSPINSYVSKAKQKQKQKQKQSKMVKRLEERSLSKQPQPTGIFELQYVRIKGCI